MILPMDLFAITGVWLGLSLVILGFTRASRIASHR